MSDEGAVGKTELPDTLRPYIAHGVYLRIKGAEAVGDCPFCNKEGKFSVNVERGVAQCLAGSCAVGLNAHTFMRKVWEYSHEQTQRNFNNGQRERIEGHYEELAQDRKLITSETLREWGVLRSYVTDEWLIPGYSVEGSLNQLYRYMVDPANKESGKRVVRVTPRTNHCLIGLPLLDKYTKEPETIYIAEGPWDAMALWETLSYTKLTVENEGEDTETVTLEYTDNPEESMLKDSAVLAVASCNVFLPSWTQLFHDKNVVILFDNDYPKVNKETGKASEPAGLIGTKRTALMLLASDTPPKSVQYLSWHPASEPYDPSRPDGYDVRDLLSEGITCDQRIDKLGQLIEMVRDVPDAWRPEAANALVYHASDMACTPCDNWDELVNEWTKAAKFTEGHDRALGFALACILSTTSKDDQLWGKLVGPAGCGKSMLCSALTVNKRYTKAVNIFTGFHSGWRNKGDNEEADHSLIKEVNMKTMITKDGDTLLQQPNLPQILSQARDIYDGESQSYYRTGRGKNYTQIRMTWLLCGTTSLHKLDNSELGERFIDCVIMKHISRELQREILWRKVNDAMRMKVVDGKAKNFYSERMSKAMALTGGYINYLRQNTQRLLDEVEVTDRCMHYCMALAELVSFLRCRQSNTQKEEVEKEIPTRLVSQLGRLAKCTTAVMNKQQIDSEVMRRVRQTGIDTSRGRNFDICSVLYRGGKVGMETSQIASITTRPEQEERNILNHLRMIGAVEGHRPSINNTKVGNVKWRLSPVLFDLYREVIANGY